MQPFGVLLGEISGADAGISKVPIRLDVTLGAI